MTDLMKQTLNQVGKSQEVEEFKNAEPVMNKVFAGLKSVFPAYKAFISSQEEEDRIKKEWIKAFKQNRITTHEQIANGFKFARRHESPYFPSVGMFIKWCKTKEGSQDPSHQTYLPPPEMTDEEQQKAKEYLKRIKEQL